MQIHLSSSSGRFSTEFLFELQRAFGSQIAGQGNMAPLYVVGLVLVPAGIAFAAWRYQRIRNRTFRVRRLHQRLVDWN